MKLDRNRKYGVVYGHAEKCFMQDGNYFDGQGTLIGKQTKPSQPVPAQEPPAVAENPDGASERVNKLNNMHIAKLKKMALKLAEQLGVDAPPTTGKGVKAKLVKWIADNTTD